MRHAPALLASLVALLALTACARGNRSAPAAATAVVTATPPASPGVDAGFSLYDLPSTWRDQRGATVRLAALAGKPRVVAMVYTSCRATCPLILADLKRVEASLPPARRGDVGFVLVSLDPARDTPGRMAEWAAGASLDPARWTLLGGDAEAVREIAAALGVRYQPAADEELAHTNVITVLDAAGAPVHQQLGLGADTKGTVAALDALPR